MKSFKNVSAALGLFLLLPILIPEPTLAQSFPDEEMLYTLEERLTSEPDCFVDLSQCAQVEKMSINVNANSMQLRLRVHASTSTAIPLPASQDTWLPTQILIDGKPASAFARDAEQTIWLSVETGIRDVVLSGPMYNEPHFHWHYRLNLISQVGQVTIIVGILRVLMKTALVTNKFN